jgi:hypothetical protein
LIPNKNIKHLSLFPTCLLLINNQTVKISLDFALSVMLMDVNFAKQMNKNQVDVQNVLILMLFLPMGSVLAQRGSI